LTCNRVSPKLVFSYRFCANNFAAIDFIDIIFLFCHWHNLLLFFYIYLRRGVISIFFFFYYLIP
jgi:hypothetical protein